MYKGSRFQAQDDSVSEERRIRNIVRWLAKRRYLPKELPRDLEPRNIHRERVPHGMLHATLINHSTILLQIDGANVLTDPIWSPRCGPFKWLGPKRLAPPGINFQDMPPVDIVLISHNHYDHMDIPTLRKIYERDKPLFCVPLGNRKFLQKKGLRNIIEFSWWSSERILDLDIHFVPAKHYTRRGLFDNNKSLWGGFVLQGSSQPVYFAGDTAYGNFFKQIYRRFGPPSLSLLPIGSFEPRPLMKEVHMSPEEAVQAHLDLHSAQSIGIHFGTFRLGDESFADPIIELKESLAKNNIPENRFITLENGFGLSIEHY